MHNLFSGFYVRRSASVAISYLLTTAAAVELECTAKLPNEGFKLSMNIGSNTLSDTFSGEETMVFDLDPDWCVDIESK